MLWIGGGGQAVEKGETEAAGERTAEGEQEVRAQPPKQHLQGLLGRQNLPA
jgi:hypothetical protein